MAHRGRHSADDKLAAALASGLTVRDAAAVADVAERTATRRMADAGFRRQVVELRSATVRSAAGKLADGMTAAADTLRGLLTHADDSLRLRAASKLRKAASKLFTKGNIKSEIAAAQEELRKACNINAKRMLRQLVAMAIPVRSTLDTCDTRQKRLVLQSISTSRKSSVERRLITRYQSSVE